MSFLSSTKSEPGTESNPAVSANEILEYDPNSSTGFYWIQADGMANAQRIWCDMDVDGGGWMRFWWHGTYEITGNDPSSLPSGDKLGVSDISTINPDSENGYGTVPSGVTPSDMMVKGDGSGTSKDGDKLRYGLYRWDTSNTTASAVLDAFRDQITTNGTSLDSWTPYQTNANLPSAQSNYFWYDLNGSGSFNLDDDGAYANSEWIAGFEDGDNHYGTEFNETTNPAMVETDNLVFYWR